MLITVAQIAVKLDQHFSKSDIVFSASLTLI